MLKPRASLLATLSLLVLSACGGSSGGGPVTPPPPPPPPPISVAEAWQFLNQASFGATIEDAEAVRDSTPSQWIDAQMALPVSLQLPHLRSLPSPQFDFELQRDRIDIFFRNAVTGDDQLRQRVAFALSEIMVVSQNGALINYPYALADYNDLLARNAFGNFRQLLQEVTLHPAMGVYLSMLGNEKPDPTRNIRPDENYARELMQLFSIGLVELNTDGTTKLDSNNQPIPTYSQSIIEGFAHVYTGWNFAGAPSFEFAFPNANNQTLPMQLYASFHDDGAKQLLNGTVIPAGQSGDVDLAAALDNIFAHPNVGPFIAIRLIQRLVTSNPSPGYIGRVAAVFNNNGNGIRGDLAAVVRAILLDAEARPELPMEIDGKLKEPLLRLTQLWRAYDAQSVSGSYAFDLATYFLGQGPLQAPSVFNFFTPFYAPPGEIRDSSLVAPELQIATEFQNTLVTNYFLFVALAFNSANPDLTDDDIFINIDAEVALASDADALIDLVASKLLAGEIASALRAEIAGMLALIPETESALRAAEVIYFVSTSPEFAYQH